MFEGRPEVERKTPITTMEQASAYLERCKDLGSTVRPAELSKLRESNMEVLEVLRKSIAEKTPAVEPGKWAVIIPAYKEKDIGQILMDVTSQLSKLPKVATGFTEAQIIVSINAEEEGGMTHQAVDQYLSENPLPEGVSLKKVTIAGQGKLVAFDNALNHLEAQKTFPQYLFFFDADSKLKDGCFAAVSSLLATGNVKAAGPKIVQKEPQNIREAISQLPTAGHGEKGTAWLQGGAFAINAELAPLYHAYVRAFPGTIANDVNWSMIMREKDIPFQLTKEPYLDMDTPANMAELVRQQSRWLQGARLSGAFISTDPNVITETSVIKRFAGRVRGYFPGFPHVSREELSRFVDRGIKKELWGAPFYAGLFMAIDKLDKPITLTIQGKKIEVGGSPPNPYIPKGWQPPREYLQ